jgi:hypothetical protein
MGVHGLWDVSRESCLVFAEYLLYGLSAKILAVTGQSRSLANLAIVEGFEDNKSGRRAYRIGIDASIW